MPDTEEVRQQFGQPGNPAEGGGLPTVHRRVALDAPTGLPTRVVAAPWRPHDLRQAAVLHQDLDADDWVGGDRAFGSHAPVALCRQRKVHGLFRAHQRRLVAFGRRRRSGVAATGPPRWELVGRLGRHDQLVKYVQPPQRPAGMTREAYAALPASLGVREVRFRVRQRGRRAREGTVVTTLRGPRRYPAEPSAQLYAWRWQAAVDLRPLKTTRGMDDLRCQTFGGVRKELLLFVVVYNLVRRVRGEAGRRPGVRPDRLRFVDALRWLRQARRGEEVPRLRVNPERPGRVPPRAQKRRPKPYDLLNQPRAVLRAKLLQQDSPPKRHAA